MDIFLLIVGLAVFIFAHLIGPNPSKSSGLTRREMHALSIGIGLVVGVPLLAAFAGEEAFSTLLMTAVFGPVLVATIAGRRFFLYALIFVVLGVESWAMQRLYQSSRAPADWNGYMYSQMFLPLMALLVALVSIAVYVVWEMERNA